jgi:hypothetical protein
MGIPIEEDYLVRARAAPGESRKKREARYSLRRSLTGCDCGAST